MSADQLVSALLSLATDESVCILDSCGIGHLGSHLLIAGIDPVEMIEFSSSDPNKALLTLDNILTGERAAIFTLSYDLGRKMLKIGEDELENETLEPDLFAACFDVFVIHDYDTRITKLVGNSAKFGAIASKLREAITPQSIESPVRRVSVVSNFTKPEYLRAIEAVKEHIRDGETYQTNLTQQLTARLPDDLKPEIVFARLRRDHPAPFSAFITRQNSTVISASPERFFKVSSNSGTSSDPDNAGNKRISTSPIKGTRPRGRTKTEDEWLRAELLTSQKDRAENTMIVDLLRNDLGRVCNYGSVNVENLCDLEEHPSLFHMVSTISGDLRSGVRPSEIFEALYPCGSITGAPKLSTMKIIDEIEPTRRGLSMGAIGYYLPADFGAANTPFSSDYSQLDLSVAIRTMVIHGQAATFNVGGGIVIDSDPESEFAETLTKAEALLGALGGNIEF